MRWDWKPSSAVSSDRPWSRRWIEWLSYRGGRGWVALLIVLSFLGFFAAVLASAHVPLEDLQATYYIYSGLIAGNVTLVTLVVAINQLLLPRIMYRPQEVEAEIEGLLEYRMRIEELTGEVAPVEPSAFLHLLLEATRETAQDLGGLTHGPHSAIEGFEGFVTGLTAHLDEVDDMIERPAATFDVLLALIETNYAEYFNRLRLLRSAHGDELSEEALTVVDDLLALLKDLDIGRQYFKSIYLQRELSTLSQVILLTGLPAIGVLVAALLALTVPAGLPEVIDRPGVLFVTTLTIGMVPLSVLASFILRSSTIVRKTTVTPPFVSPEHDPYFAEVRRILPEGDDSKSSK